jgi:phage recombination protein Bet
MSAVETVNLVKANAAELPAAVVRRGINEAQWRTLFNLFPGAHPDSILMVVDYCSARKLDPLKKPCHIVPMRTKQGDQWVWKDVVMPGIYEYRITAQRTGLYLGHTEPVYGPEAEFLGVKAPAWCAMTFHRWNDKTQQSVPFPVKVWFAEVAGTSFDKASKTDYVNDRWSRAPIQMLTKCTEAAGLREAFPEEFGGEATAEEMDGQRPTVDSAPAAADLPKPAQRISQTSTVVDAPVVETAEAPEVAASNSQPPAAETPKAEEKPSHIGRITDIREKPDGSAALVVLDTGFAAGTQDKRIIADAKEAREMGAIVELANRPPSDPAKFKPTILEVKKARIDLMEGQQ